MRNQNLMFSLRAVLMLVVAAVMIGCQSLGLEAPKTLNQRIAYAYGDLVAIRQATTNSLNAKQLSSADAKYVLDVTDNSRSLLDAATSAMTIGDVATAEGRLLLTLNVLTQLQSYLNSKGAK